MSPLPWRTDPRTRLAACAALSIMAALLVRPINLFGLAGLSACLFAASRPAPRIAGGLAVILAVTTLGSALSQGFFYAPPGRTELFTPIPGLSLCREGLVYGLVQSSRLWVGLLSGAAVIRTTTTSELLLAMQAFRAPWPFTFMVIVGLRFLPEMLEQTRRVLAAQAVRGVSGSGPGAAFRRYRLLLTPLLVAGIRRARQTALAAEARGFGPGRVASRRLRFGAVDLMALAAMAAGLAWAACSAARAGGVTIGGIT